MADRRLKSKERKLDLESKERQQRAWRSIGQFKKAEFELLGQDAQVSDLKAVKRVEEVIVRENGRNEKQGVSVEQRCAFEMKHFEAPDFSSKHSQYNDTWV